MPDAAAGTMPLHVCIVALNAYPAIDDTLRMGFGGIETRSWLFARGLAKLPDVHVSFVVRHHTPLRQSSYDGVEMLLWEDALYWVRDSLLSRLQRLPHFPWLTLREPKWSDLYYLPRLAIGKLLRRRHDPRLPLPFFADIPADLFLTFGVQSNSATVIASAHTTQRSAVLFLGSDSDLDERYVSNPDYVSVYRDRGDVCLWTIQQADGILCQTERQRQLLSQRFSRSGAVLANPIDVEAWDRASTAPPPTEVAELSRYVLWVGRADPVHKRPQLLVDLAKQSPEIQFVMVMNPRDDLCAAEVKRTAPANVCILDSVPFAQMPALFHRACCFINTSELEGFPNTFLQAALSRVPVASLAVEAEFLQRVGGGFCAAGDLSVLGQYIQEIWHRPPDQNTLAAARTYVSEHHGLQSQALELASFLRAVRDNPVNSRHEEI